MWGVILTKLIFKNVTRLKMGLQRIYFSLVKGLSKMAFPHLKLNALRIDRSCFHARIQNDLFIQIKVRFWVTSWGFIFLFWFCLFAFKFSRYMFTLLKNHLNFQNAFVLDKYQHDVYFCTYFGGPKNILENIWDYVWCWKNPKENTEGFVMV